MARIDAAVLKEAIDTVNHRMQRAGADYRYRYAAVNGYHAVDAYKGDRNLFRVGSGTPKECIMALYSDAFDRMGDAYNDRLREAAAEFTAPAPRKEFRLKITDPRNNVRFITRGEDGSVSLVGRDGMPYGLCDIAHTNTTELRFALKDAATLDEAVNATRRFIYKHMTVEGIKG